MYILLDGINNKSIGLSLVSRPEIPTPERIIEYIEVDGRNGSLTKKGAYKNITIPMEFSFLGVYASIKQMLREVNRWTIGKAKLAFSDDSEFYYNLKNIVVKSTVNDIDIYGRVTIDFVCSPFQYQENNQITLTESSTLFNPGTIESEPLLKIFGSGNATITINGQEIKLNNISDYMSVDCELKEVHRNGISRNSNMFGEFPVFKVGENNIFWNEAVTKIIVEPRWCYI